MVEQAPFLWEKHGSVQLPGRDPRLLFFGDDHEGVPLEVIGVKMESRRLVIIHAMFLRPRFRSRYEEAKNAKA